MNSPGVTINGTTLDNFADRYDYGFEFGVGYIFPFTLRPASNWSFSTPVDSSVGTATVAIELWDNDDCDHPFCDDTGILGNDDDQVDISPTGSETLTLSINLNSGQWSGDVAFPQSCAQGTGGEAVRICFDISTQSASGDLDGDGLLDGWEQNGYNADGDSTIDVDLPALGADPRHKDLFLELDYEAGQAPAREDIQAMKAAFRAAPLTNPDGVNGVNLWVDMGNLVDANAREGQASGTCNDGIDNGGDGLVDGGDGDCTYLDGSVEDPGTTTCANGTDDDGDGLVDAADPDCLVGDNLGGGSAVATIGACNLDATWYAAKAVNFNPVRAAIFRYSTSLTLSPSCPSSGGWGEIGGNDFMDFNHDGGTILHELGHTLNLEHGGNEGNNCKPNYVSVMNYDNQFGINRVGGGTILDYAPPRIAASGTSRGLAPLATLVENDLDDGVILDASDSANRYVFLDPAANKVQRNLNQGANWNSNTDPPAELNQVINIDSADSAGNPGACANGSNNDSLESFNDWNALSIPFRQFGDSATGAINPQLTPSPTLAQLLALRESLNKTDLRVAMSDTPDPVAAGTQLSYTAVASNDGPNPSSSTRLTLNLPTEVAFVSANPACSHAGGVLTCNLGELAAGSSAQVQVTVAVPADLVYVNGGPKTVSAVARVTNLNGPEADPSDNEEVEDTLVVAVADVGISSVTVTSPLEVLIGQPAPLQVATVVANAGPSSPIDVVVSSQASASPGATITPAGQTTNQAALSIGSPRTVSQDFTVACSTPGEKILSFDYEVELSNAADTDPDLTNNEKQASVVIDCVVPIAVNIRPGGFPNSINLNTDATLAALTTKAGEYGLPLDFDAATIQIQTVRYGLRAKLFNVAVASGAVELHDRVHLEDSYELNERTRDRDRDGVMHFKPSASGLTSAITEACLKGRFTSGSSTYTFFGCDSVVVRP